MGIQFEGIGDVYMFILVVLLGQLGEHLDNSPMGGYGCPLYCEADHKHVMRVDGYISNTGTLRDTCGSYDSLWVFHLETESIYSEGISEQDRNELSQDGRDNH